MQTLYFAYTSDNVGKWDELWSNHPHNPIKWGRRDIGVMPHTSKGTPKMGPTPREEGQYWWGEAKEGRREGLPLITPLSLFLFSLNLICLLFFLYIHRWRPSLFIDNFHDPISIGLLTQTCIESIQYSWKDSYMRYNYHHIWQSHCTHFYTHMGHPQLARFQILVVWMYALEANLDWRISYY